MHASEKESFIKIMRSSSGFNLSQIKQKFEELNEESFITIFQHMLQEGDEFLALQLIYYFTLFRESYHIKSLFKSCKIPLQFLEYLIASLQSRSFGKDKDDEYVLDRIMVSFSQENYLELLLHSKVINQDAGTLFYLMTKLERKYIDIFFNSSPNLDNILKKLFTLDQNIIRYIFIHNTDLYGYLTMFIEVSGDKEIQEGKLHLYDKIEEIQNTRKLILNVASQFDISKEKELHLSERNKKRFAYIIQQVQHHENKLDLLSAMTREGVIIDDIEESLILEIIQNPIFKSVLDQYTKLEHFADSKDSDALTNYSVNE